MDRLKNKVAIVTGGANGIGRANSELFAQEGARVLVIDVDDQAGLSVVEGIRSRGQGAEFCHADVSSSEEVASAVELAAKKWGRIDILCNNAAYLGQLHSVLEATPEEWEQSINVTLMGAHYCTRHVLPHMISQKYGAIVNIASIQALVGCPASVAYAASKSALLGFTLSAAYDYGRYNIRVNAVCPGAIQTRISPRPDDPFYDWQCRQTLLGRVGDPKDVAWAALFLASDEAAYITGGMLAVDGGWTSK